MTQQSRPCLLLTRPAAQSQRFAGEISARFGAFDTVISPLLAPRFLPAHPPAQTDAVIFTSETGVAGAQAAGMRAQGTAYCVGARTAQAAAAAGYAARDAGGDWRDLVALIGQDRPLSLTFLCAREAPPHLQDALAQAGHSVQRIEVYAQDAQPLSAEAKAFLQGARPVLLPLFSPRSAQVFCDQATARAPIHLAALSDAVADAFTLPFARKAVAHRPNSAALLDAIAQLLD